MRYVADLHIHSPYSRATSRGMTPEGLWYWAQLKGIGVIGTGDFTHPGWLGELRRKLEPAEPGLYRLRPEFEREAPEPPESCRAEVRFLMQAEISSIYKWDGRTRKVHSIILAPSIDVAGAISARLDAIGNVRSDGRPILGMGAREILGLALDTSPECMVIPAHAWTPWFSVFGSMSGFDSLDECYGDLTPHVHAIETGLSSDPPMNRRLSALDGVTLISNSDAHSPSKLGREANVFDTEMSYEGLARAIRTREGFLGTYEFYPEEGKYHVDGHRKCGVRLAPGETRRLGGVCPECGGRVTVGVLSRVEGLADREAPVVEAFSYIVPLQEIVAECMGRGVNTKGVVERYMGVLGELGPEFGVLLDAELGDIERVGGERLGRAVGLMRGGEIVIEPGYDGEFGTVRIFK